MAITCKWECVMGKVTCKRHDLKRILEDENHYDEYNNIRLNGAYPETWQIAKLLVKHGHEVTIYNSKK